MYSFNLTDRYKCKENNISMVHSLVTYYDTDYNDKSNDNGFCPDESYKLYDGNCLKLLVNLCKGLIFHLFIIYFEKFVMKKLILKLQLMMKQMKPIVKNSQPRNMIIIGIFQMELMN